LKQKNTFYETAETETSNTINLYSIKRKLLIYLTRKKMSHYNVTVLLHVLFVSVPAVS